MATTLIGNFWQIQDLEGVSALQTTVAPGDLLLNGTYVNPSTTTISFKDQGFARNISLTSTNDLSAATFTISGVQNSTVVSSNISGPNNNTVTTAEVYDIISSVSVDMAVSDIQVGTGLDGYFPLINRGGSSLIAFRSSLLSYALSFATQASNGCTYQIYQSLENLENNGETYADMVADQSFISINAPYANVTQILQKTDACQNILISVTSALDTSTLKMRFLQLL